MLDLVRGIGHTVFGQGVAAVVFFVMWAGQLLVCLHHRVDTIWREFESVERGGCLLFAVYVTV